MAEIPTLEWDDFLARIDWQQGQHVGLIGPTGEGKTTLALALLPRRDFVIALGTKSRDKTLDQLITRGWKRFKDVAKLPDFIETRPYRMVFWPPHNSDEDVPRQAYQIGAVSRWAYHQRNWCLYIDELWYVQKVLGLTKLVEWLLTQARSNGVSVVAATQRPAHVTLLLYDQPTHLFFWGDNDERNLKRIAGLNGANPRLVRDTVMTLKQYEVLYVRTRHPRWMAKTTPPAP